MPYNVHKTTNIRNDDNLWIIPFSLITKNPKPKDNTQNFFGKKKVQTPFGHL